MGEGEKETDKQTHRWVGSPVGGSLQNPKIITWAEVRYLANWATQVLQMFFYINVKQFILFNKFHNFEHVISNFLTYFAIINILTVVYLYIYVFVFIPDFLRLTF